MQGRYCELQFVAVAHDVLIMLATTTADGNNHCCAASMLVHGKFRMCAAPDMAGMAMRSTSAVPLHEDALACSACRALAKRAALLLQSVPCGPARSWPSLASVRMY